ncbi:hypothetical protein FGRMN_3850 [Fusarium graminum]|nr:hypothetical protein FGRMN_3850 [Fusarium graminum]
MRLINVNTGELNEFSSTHRLEYATLSHTWEQREITYQEWLGSRLHAPNAAKKVLEACRVAKDSLKVQLLWADTCCINKSNRREVDQAVNSMFAWYRNSTVCLAYLSDIPTANTNASKLLSSQLRRSRWFTRGWTLVELLAPRQLIFYAADWSVLGRREDSLVELISQVTGIDAAYLSGQKDPWQAPVSEKMSWLSNRKTRLVEDRAYCMFGLLDVEMHLDYGEGIKAMDRLQREISKVTASDNVGQSQSLTQFSMANSRSSSQAKEGRRGGLDNKIKGSEHHDSSMSPFKGDSSGDLWHGNDTDDIIDNRDFIRIHVLDQHTTARNILGNILKRAVSARVMHIRSLPRFESLNEDTATNESSTLEFDVFCNPDRFNLLQLVESELVAKRDEIEYAYNLMIDMNVYHSVKLKQFQDPSLSSRYSDINPTAYGSSRDGQETAAMPISQAHKFQSSPYSPATSQGIGLVAKKENAHSASVNLDETRDQFALRNYHTEEYEQSDTTTIYSIETLSDDPKLQYFQAFVDQLSEDVGTGIEGTVLQNVEPDYIGQALKEFSWRLHEESSNPFQLETSVIIHRKRKNIVDLLDFETTEHEIPESESDQSFLKSEVDTDDGDLSTKVPFRKPEETIAAWISELAPGAETPIGLSQMPEYKKFIQQSSAYQWLLIKIRQYSRLTCEGPSIMDKIGATIRDKLMTHEKLRKMSRTRAPVSIDMNYSINWDLVGSMRSRGASSPLSIAFPNMLSLTGIWDEAQAMTVIEYMNQTWPRSGGTLVAVLQGVLSVLEEEDTNGKASAESRHSFSLGHLKVYLSDQYINFSVTGGRYLVSEVGEQIAWLTSALHAAPGDHDGLMAISPRVSSLEINSPSRKGKAIENAIAICTFEFDQHYLTAEDAIAGLCWKRLFCSPVLVYGYPILRRSIPKSGLEIPLKLAASIMGSLQDATDSESAYDWVYNPAELKDKWPGAGGRQAAINTLKNWDNRALDLHIVGKHADASGRMVPKYSTFEDRVKKILHSIEILIDQREKCASQDGFKMSQTWDPRRDVIGFEVVDITGPSGPIYPRVQRINSWGHGWTDLVPSIGLTTIFGRGFGDLIRADNPEELCPKWRLIPSGKDFLAASVSTLQMLFEKRLLKLEPGRSEDEIAKRVNIVTVKESSNPCSCVKRQGVDSKPSPDADCHHKPVQFLTRRWWLLGALPNGLIPVRFGSLPVRGAVILGHTVLRLGSKDILMLKRTDDDGTGSTTTSDSVQAASSGSNATESTVTTAPSVGLSSQGASGGGQRSANASKTNDRTRRNKWSKLKDWVKK